MIEPILVQQCSFTGAKKNFSQRFLTQNYFFAVKIANHYDKQLTPLNICDQDGFFEPGFCVSSYSNYEAGILTTIWPPNQGEMG